MARPSHLTSLIPRFVTAPFYDILWFWGVLGLYQLTFQRISSPQSRPWVDPCNPAAEFGHMQQRHDVCSEESNSENWTERNISLYIYIRMQKDIAGKSSKVWKRYHSLQVLQKVTRVTNRSECEWRHWDTDNGWQFGLCLCTFFLWQDVARSW